MKIRSVEIPHDDSQSTGSDTLDSSHQGIPAHPHAVEQYEKTIGSFAAAMTELHTELRDKTVECEALYETAHNLSRALQESDRLLQEKTLECERLLLKLQMVTFVEPSDESGPLSFLEEQYFEQQEEEEDYTIPQRPAAILEQLSVKHGGKKTSTSKPKPETKKERNHVGKKDPKNSANKAQTSQSSDVDFVTERMVHMETIAEGQEAGWIKDISNNGAANVSSSEPSTETTVFKRRGAAGPVCVDDAGPVHGPVCVDDDCDEVDEFEEVEIKEDPNAKFSVGPRQAHFYHVILERDMAVQTNKKLTRELKYTRNKVRELKAKLGRSISLVELSYYKNEGKQQKQLSRKSLFAAAAAAPKSEKSDCDSVASTESRRRSSLPWLRKHGMSVRHRDTNGCVSFISEDEMLSNNWNKTDDKTAAAALEHEYLKAIMSDDADRAGGHVPVQVDV